jgi:outer membrane receptor protein involved in Fe transport
MSASASPAASTRTSTAATQQLSALFAASYSNSWQTRGGLQQIAAGITPVGGEDTLQPDVDYRFFSTENRILVNGLVGFGYKFGEHQLKWTNLFIRDTLKEARVQTGTNQINVGSDLVNISNTAWFERQLIDTQLVSEFDFGPIDIDLRATYAQSQRKSPYERTISYRYDERARDFVNDLRSNGQFARVAFSNLVDNVYSAAGDIAYRFPGADVTLSAGAAFLKNDRRATRRDFRYTPLDILPGQVPQERPDFLLSDFNIYTYNIVLTDLSGTAGAARYEADLETRAAYLQGEAEILPGVRLQGGVRFESGEQSVTPIDLFGLGGADITASAIKEEYFLPAATVTWTFADNMQLRLHGSKTIARPQFRELAPQQYSDPETDRTFFGNQFLTDSELLNAEARFEWYFARDQRVSLAGFWKKIDRPIETVAFQQGGTFFTTFANAPSATLKGAEFELQNISRWTASAAASSRPPAGADRQLHLLGIGYQGARRRHHHSGRHRRRRRPGAQRVRRRHTAYRPVQAPRQPPGRPGKHRSPVPADPAVHLLEPPRHQSRPR